MGSWFTPPASPGASTVGSSQIVDGSVAAVDVAADLATQAELDALSGTYAPIASPTFTGTVTGRIGPRVTSVSSSATPTFNTDNCDALSITALATAITSMTSSMSGTPTNFQKLVVRFKDDGNARAITWGASFESVGATLPTTTTAGKRTTVGLIYDSVAAKWGCVAAVTEA